MFKYEFLQIVEHAKKEKWKTLDLSKEYITVLQSEIGELDQLEEIDLGWNKLSSLPDEFSKLKRLRVLILNGNTFDAIPEVVFTLHNLQILQISANKINKLSPEIGNLTSLRELFIPENSLKELPEEIGNLVNLEVLDVGFVYGGKNELSDLPVSIKNLKNLKELRIGANQFRTLPKEIGDLINLEILRAPVCELENLPTELGNLQSLIELDLIGNKLSHIPIEIGQLKRLKELKLDRNHITAIPREIGNLASLELLSLRANQIEQLPSEIGGLKSLKKLDLGYGSEISDTVGRKILGGNNRIKALPVEIQTLSRLIEMDLRGNPIDIPPEILEKTKEPNAILKYYFSVVFEERKPINETKLVFVGQGSVGKTSLVNRTVHNSYNLNEIKTDGITISKWAVKNSRVDKSEITQITLNLWDFGGQEIMHATHQFFLTKRSLYVLVLDSRLTQEENRVEYWLKIIQSFGGESPVLIVGNKIDQHPLDIDRTGLQKKYPNIVGILETSAATGAGIEELKAAITKQVNNLPHVRDMLPETWFTVKTKLEELGKQSNFITHDKYLDLCVENEVSDETSQRTLIGFLHDLGVVLHFQDDPRLEALGILNPQWVTNGVYKILNSHALFQNKGVLTTSMLDEILNLPEYPRGKRLFIVDMMKKFELCYDIEPDKTFLVPDLLPKDQPELQFNGIPAFEYAYPVLPSSVITRFIVRMNQKIDDGFVWRTGVVLKIGENKALVKADIEDRKITIAIDGLEHTRRDALSAIRFQLDEIHASIKGLNPEKRVPIPGAPQAEAIKYEYLLMLEQAEQETLLAQDGSRLVKVNVREILSGIEHESQRKETGAGMTNHIYIGGNVSGNLVVGDGIQVIQNSFNKIGAAEIQPELKETLKLLTEAVSALDKALPAEQFAEMSDDLTKLVDEAVKPKPNQKWYSVSIEGLIKAAENLDKLGEPVLKLSRKVLSLLTGG